MQIRKTEESQRSILMRIMTNYLQVMTSVFSYNINFPQGVLKAFVPAEKIGAPQEPFLSFD